MTTDATGNVLHVPGFHGGDTPTTDDEILASYSGLTQKGLTLETTASTVLAAGTVLKAGAGSYGTNGKKYVGCDKSGAEATPQTSAPVGILRKQVDVSAEDKLANVVLAGRIKGSKVKYTDDTNGLSAAELVKLAGYLGGHYDAVHDMLIF